jgi:hypothetical protein
VNTRRFRRVKSRTSLIPSLSKTGSTNVKKTRSIPLPCRLRVPTVRASSIQQPRLRLGQHSAGVYRCRHWVAWPVLAVEIRRNIAEEESFRGRRIDRHRGMERTGQDRTGWFEPTAHNVASMLRPASRLAGQVPCSGISNQNSWFQGTWKYYNEILLAGTLRSGTAWHIAAGSL